MKERPIIFSADSVRAILDGRKTQTRRVMKPQPEFDAKSQHWLVDYGEAEQSKNTAWPENEAPFWTYCPYGLAGERLWVRETWAKPEPGIMDRDHDGSPIYAADFPALTATGFGPWKSPIFMPRWTSRLTLELTAVRAERVQQISLDGFVAEGGRIRDTDVGHVFELGADGYRSPLDAFKAGWDAINSKRGFPWDSNPWVWVLEFRRLP